MPPSLRQLFLFILVFTFPLSATAQFNLIQMVPGQADDEWGINGQTVVEAPNGDVLVFIGKNGEVTDASSFPFEGLPAQLILHRKTNSLFWESPVTLDTAIENGVQSLGQPKAVVLPDGRILLTYFYHNDFAPNFSVSHKVLISADNGVSWQPLTNKDRETATLGVTPGGTVVALDWVEDEVGNLSFHTSVYDAQSDSWSPRAKVADFDPICTQTLHVESETEWHFYYADCFFGYGGSNTVYRQVSTDAGASWGAAEAVFTADSGVGGTLGSIVRTNDGNLMAVYSSGTFMAYRMSSDGGATWSEPENWTGNTVEYGDISPGCSASSAGPLCLFLGRRGAVNQLVHIGVASVSADPLVVGSDFALNAGFSDAWFNIDTAGQGFLVTVYPSIKLVFVAWFTYDTERPPESVEAILGEPGHRWMTAQGTFEGNIATLTVYQTSGGVFDAAEPAAETDPAGDGSLTIEFADCYAGAVSYTITSAGVSGVIPIRRLAEDNVPLCEQLSGL